MTHIKRDLTGIGTTVENPFIIQLITGETISLQPIGEDKWIVNIEGRPWQWIDYWGAPDLDYWNIVAYFGKQSELREIYADLIGMQMKIVVNILDRKENGDGRRKVL